MSHNIFKTSFNEYWEVPRTPWYTKVRRALGALWAWLIEPLTPQEKDPFGYIVFTVTHVTPEGRRIDEVITYKNTMSIRDLIRTKDYLTKRWQGLRAPGLKGIPVVSADHDGVKEAWYTDRALTDEESEATRRFFENQISGVTFNTEIYVRYKDTQYLIELKDMEYP